MQYLSCAVGYAPWMLKMLDEILLLVKQWSKPTWIPTTLIERFYQVLTMVLFQYLQAVDMYREVLRSVEEHKGLLKTDRLQQLHAMFNLNEILQTKPDGVAPTLRDDQLSKQVS